MVKTTKVTKWGDSLGIRIPREFVKAANLEEKMSVELRSDGDELIIRRLPELLSLEELALSCRDWDGKPPEKFNWGEPVGREIL